MILTRNREGAEQLRISEQINRNTKNEEKEYVSFRESQELYVVKRSRIWNLSRRRGKMRSEKSTASKERSSGRHQGRRYIRSILYKDSQDRLIATTRTPKVRLGETAVLRVADTGKIGAFLDWGLERICFFHIKSRQSVCSRGRVSGGTLH